LKYQKTKEADLVRSEENEAGWLTPVKETDAAACKDVLLLLVVLVRGYYYMIYKAPPQKNPAAAPFNSCQPIISPSTDRHLVSDSPFAFIS